MILLIKLFFDNLYLHIICFVLLYRIYFYNIFKIKLCYLIIRIYYLNSVTENSQNIIVFYTQKIRLLQHKIYLISIHL